MKEHEQSTIDIPVQERIVTDYLCYSFSIPIILSVVLIFILVFVSGLKFSFLHPEAKDGMWCGIDNSVYGNFSNLKKQNLLAASGKCIKDNDCNGVKLFSFCIPSDKIELINADMLFKVAFDFCKYWKLAICMFAGILLLAFPIYLVCSKIIGFVILSLSILLFIFSVVLSVLHIRNIYVVSIFAVIDILVLKFVFSLKPMIQIFNPLVSVSTNIFMKAKTVFLASLFIIVTTLLTIMISIFGILFTLGIGKPNVHLFKLTFVRDNSFKITIVLFWIIGHWMVKFFLSLTKTVVSYIVSSGFFKRDISSFFHVCLLMIKYHSGTLLFGSFIDSIIGNLSIIYNLFKHTIPKTKNTFVRAILKCISFVFFLLVRLIGESNQLSFTFTAMKGFSFWDGCQEAKDVLRIDSIFNIDLFLKIVFSFSKFMLFLISFIGTYLYAIRLDLFIPIIPALLISILSYFGLYSIDIVIETSCKTLLLCVFEDANDQGKYTPKELEDLLHCIEEKIKVL